MRRRYLLVLAMAVALGSVLALPQGVDALNDDAIVDLAINDLPLLAPEDTEQALSSAAVVHAAASIRYKFANADGSQTLTLTAHPGDERFSVSVVSVDYAAEPSGLPVLPGGPDAFVTRKGIRLGMARADIEALIGEPAYLVGETSIYELSGDTALLRRYNMPIYRATYAFKDDLLIGFQFGFPYP